MKKYEFKEFKPNEKLKLVDTEDEYWEAHAYYMGKLKRLKYNLKKFIYEPDEYLKEFESILIDMVTTGVMSIEDSNELRGDLYKALNNPKPFQKWIEKNKEKFKKLVKKGKNPVTD